METSVVAMEHDAAEEGEVPPTPITGFDFVYNNINTKANTLDPVRESMNICGALNYTPTKDEIQIIKTRFADPIYNSKDQYLRNIANELKDIIKAEEDEKASNTTKDEMKKLFEGNLDKYKMIYNEHTYGSTYYVMIASNNPEFFVSANKGDETKRNEKHINKKINDYIQTHIKLGGPVHKFWSTYQTDIAKDLGSEMNELTKSVNVSQRRQIAYTGGFFSLCDICMRIIMLKKGHEYIRSTINKNLPMPTETKVLQLSANGYIKRTEGHANKIIWLYSIIKNAQTLNNRPKGWDPEQYNRYKQISARLITYTTSQTILNITNLIKDDKSEITPTIIYISRAMFPANDKLIKRYKHHQKRINEIFKAGSNDKKNIKRGDKKSTLELLQKLNIFSKEDYIRNSEQSYDSLYLAILLFIIETKRKDSDKQNGSDIYTVLASAINATTIRNLAHLIIENQLPQRLTKSNRNLDIIPDEIIRLINEDENKDIDTIYALRASEICRATDTKLRKLPYTPIVGIDAINRRCTTIDTMFDDLMAREIHETLTSYRIDRTYDNKHEIVNATNDVTADISGTKMYNNGNEIQIFDCDINSNTFRISTIRNAIIEQCTDDENLIKLTDMIVETQMNKGYMDVKTSTGAGNLIISKVKTPELLKHGGSEKTRKYESDITIVYHSGLNKIIYVNKRKTITEYKTVENKKVMTPMVHESGIDETIYYRQEINDKPEQIGWLTCGNEWYTINPICLCKIPYYPLDMNQLIKRMITIIHNSPIIDKLNYILDLNHSNVHNIKVFHEREVLIMFKFTISYQSRHVDITIVQCNVKERKDEINADGSEDILLEHIIQNLKDLS